MNRTQDPADDEQRPTKPVSAEFNALRAESRAAEERGESAVGPMYRAMDEDAKAAFARSREQRRAIEYVDVPPEMLELAEKRDFEPLEEGDQTPRLAQQPPAEPLRRARSNRRGITRASILDARRALEEDDRA